MRTVDAGGVGPRLFYGGLRALGVAAASRRLRNAGVVLCYHNVVASGTRAGSPEVHLPCDRFAWQMRWLASRYETVSLREFVDRMRAGRSLRALAAVTFDDGYAGVFEHAVPILEALRIPATVFVVTEAVGTGRPFWWDEPAIVDSITPDRRKRWLEELQGDGAAILSGHRRSAERELPASHLPADWTTIRASLHRGIDIGVHSATHRALPTLTDAELEAEVVQSRDVVQRATGIKPELFAYPYGHLDARVRARVYAAGYRAGVALQTGLNDARTDPWWLRRVNVPAGISDAAFDAWTAGLHARRSA